MKPASPVPDDVSRRSPDEVTESLNAVLADIGRSTDPFVTRATQQILKQSKW